jgi:hypothetical protein
VDADGARMVICQHPSRIIRGLHPDNAHPCQALVSLFCRLDLLFLLHIYGNLTSYTIPVHLYTLRRRLLSSSLAFQHVRGLFTRMP